MPEDRFFREAARVVAMNSPTLIAAGGTGCVGARRRDTESQGGTIEVGPDQATADGRAQKLGQKQERPPKSCESWVYTKGG